MRTQSSTARGIGGSLLELEGHPGRRINPAGARWVAGCLGLLACLAWTLGAAAAALDLPESRPGEWVRVAGDGQTNRVHTLERSVDLKQWEPAAVLHHAGWVYRDPRSDGAFSFFRVQSRAMTASDDGRNHVRVPWEPFANEDPDEFSFAPAVRWVKFAARVSDPDRVWFQDSRKHAFHYDWARLRLPGFAGMTRAQFDSVTLYASNRQAVLGAVLIPPSVRTPEFGVQLVGQDPFSREEVEFWVRRVAAAVQAPDGWQAYYVPTFEQAETARVHAAWFESRGIRLATADRWLSSDAVYAAGWAVGRLVFVRAGEIKTAYATGVLRPDDILLTDAVPAEVPYVAGIVTLSPATPNSHVAILAETYGIPFGWPSDPSVRAGLPGWSGREVAVRMGGYRNQVEVIDLTGQLTEELRAAIRVRKAVKPLVITPKARLGTYWTNTTTLVPSDVRHVGGKAANYGLLRRVLPANSQPAIALTFDLWDDFMAQVLPGGRTLAEEIALRLGGVTYPPADVGDVTARLAGVRDLIRRTARFDDAQKAAIVALLQASGIPTDRKIRFRSSTNVEDTESFTGAGLYDSYSGCLTDDLDGDTAGPSACDPEEPEERGVFRAIQRVYASFYNDNAFLERRRLGVDETKVGMAVLVHESFPDPDELANGVTTLNWRKSGSWVSSDWRMVTQPGAESVTNPDPAARPEVVEGFRFSADTSVALRTSSGLVPLGGTVLRWDSEYREFGRLFNRVADAYQALAGGRTEYSLDFEFKKSASRGLQVKQVRPLPRTASSGTLVPFLFDHPTVLCVQQGEFGNAFAIHRLKSTWTLSMRALELRTGNLGVTLLRDADVGWLARGGGVSWSNGPVEWPGKGFRRTTEGTEDWLETGTGATRLRLTLAVQVPTTVGGQELPVLLPSDLRFLVKAEYGTPVATLDWNGVTTVTREEAILVPCPEVGPGSLLQTRTLPLGKAGARVVTQFYWPEPPRGPSAGYTAPCIGWVGTRIEGLTTEPIELRSDAAQTYHPFHHNFSEEFLFEPGLDPGLSVQQRQELEAANVQMLHVDWDHQTAVVRVIGMDGKIRTGL